MGFLDAVIGEAGDDAYLIPDGQGRPLKFARWIPTAAQGHSAEAKLPDRIRQIWKSDLFLSTTDDIRNVAATVKSNYSLLEGGHGLRVGIVPESTHSANKSGVYYDSKTNLWIASLSDPNGFMGMFNDAYHAVMRVVCTLGKQLPPPYWTKPSAKAQRVMEQMERFASAKAAEVEDALDQAAQQDLVGIKTRLVGVNAPGWLKVKTMAPKIISPKPNFALLD